MNPETEMPCTLTANEINLVAQMADNYVRANGLAAAAGALSITQKLVAAGQAFEAAEAEKIGAALEAAKSD